MSNVAARLLAFGFSVVVARALHPAGLGIVTYALTFASIGSILVYNASNGLARDLARAGTDKQAQYSAFSNYLVVVTCLLVSSVIVIVPIGVVVGLHGWLLAGLGACLMGNAGLEVYREVHRGHERFGAVAAFTIVANLLQLVTVIALAVLGVAEPAPYVIVFGLSPIVGIVVIERFMPGGVRLVLNAVTWDRVKRVLRFVIPLVVHSGLYMAWYGVDVLVLKSLGTLQTLGEYGAAKTLAGATVLAPAAIATALLPQVARLSQHNRPEYVRRLLVLVGASTIPPLAILLVSRDYLLHYIYGPEYVAAAAPLVILAVGTTLYGVSLTLEESWIAVGRPRVAAGVTAVAAVVTVSTAPFLVIRGGAIGAAVAFALGAAAQLACASVLTFRYLHRVIG